MKIKVENTDDIILLKRMADKYPNYKTEFTDIVSNNVNI
jgi:hypothetical protein